MAGVAERNGKKEREGDNGRRKEDGRDRERERERERERPLVYIFGVWKERTALVRRGRPMLTAAIRGR